MDYSTNTMTLFSLHKTGKIVEQCKVEEKRPITYEPSVSSFIVSLIDLPEKNVHMREYLQELFELIMKYEVDDSYPKDLPYKTKKYIFGRDNYGRQQYVRAVVFNKVNMRKGTYFYVLQQSERSMRFLLYALNREHHKSDCLGSSMKLPIASECIKDMREKLLKFTVKQAHDLDINNFMDIVSNDTLFFM